MSAFGGKADIDGCSKVSSGGLGGPIPNRLTLSIDVSRAAFKAGFSGLLPRDNGPRTGARIEVFA